MAIASNKRWTPDERLFQRGQDSLLSQSAGAEERGEHAGHELSLIPNWLGATSTGVAIGSPLHSRVAAQKIASGTISAFCRGMLIVALSTPVDMSIRLLDSRSHRYRNQHRGRRGTSGNRKNHRITRTAIW
jgi:hypothetical protein